MLADFDLANRELVELSENIVDKLANNSCGVRQFKIKDLVGNVFYIHRDLPRKLS